MERILYRQIDQPGWPDFIANKFGRFLHDVYQDAGSGDYHQEAAETIDSDIVFSLEQDGAIVGFTAVKILPEFPVGPAIYVREIAIDSAYRGGGLSHELRLWMNDVLKPSVVLGIANNPVSVISRARLFDRLGLQTYWGNVPVLPYLEPLPPHTVEAMSLAFAEKVFPEHVEQYRAGVLPYTDNQIWAQFMPDLEPNLQKVLGEILAFQLENQLPAMATLISVKLRKSA